jgi:hypothetical protein
MIGALLYYQYHSWWNRLATRLRRLRQPKYLFGAIVGGLYFYFYIFRGLGRGARGATPLAPGASELRQTLAALGFMVMLLLAWVLPHARAALTFSEAEVAFLFPAPVNRRTLIQFKLLKSQAAIFFSAILITLIGRGWGGGHFVMRMVGWWAGMSIFNLHLLGSSFALTMLMDRGISTWKRRTLFLGGAAAGLAGILYWTRRTLPPFSMPDQMSLTWLIEYVGRVFESGPIPYLLAPFRLVVAPYFAADWSQFLIALGPALCILLLHYLWVVRSNVAFEEASVEQSRKLADRMAAMRAGNWHAAQRPKKAARQPFALRPGGIPALGLFWKNLISTGQYVTFRLWLILIWSAFAGAMIFQTQSGHGAVGMFVVFSCAMLMIMSLISGPQLLRSDLRQDLPVADVLKMFPMPGWQVVLGEVLAPAAMLAGAQWVLIVFAAVFCPAQFGHFVVPSGARPGVALAAAVILPCVDLLAVLIPNAAVLLFPAWFQLGKESPRGFETMGQQLILMFGQVLVLLLGLIPAGIAFAIFFMTGKLLHWPLTGMLLGAVATSAILVVEAAIGIRLLGRLFEKFDLSGDLTG